MSFAFVSKHLIQQQQNRFIMSVQQKEPYLSQFNPLKLTDLSHNNYGQTLAISLPKVSPSYCRNKNSCFKEYQNGKKIINQLPLLIFNCNNKKTPKKNKLLRYNSEQKTQDRLESVSPFFKNYIRKSLQRRKSQHSSQTSTIQSPKKHLMQVVSLDSISQNLPQTPKLQIKPCVKRPDMLRHEATLKMKLLNTINHNQNEIGELKINKKEIKITKQLPKPILKIKCKFNSYRHTTLKRKEEDVSPWMSNHDACTIILND